MKVVHHKKQEIQKSLLVYADWNCTTGFGAVAKELVDEWAKDKKLSILIFGINDNSKLIYDYLPNVKVIPALLTGDKDTKGDIYRRIELLKIIYQNDFDAIFFLQDVEVINTMEEQLREVKNTKRKENRPNFKSMIYFPVDSEPRMVDLKVLSFFDEVVTYTEYAKGVMKCLISDTLFKKIRVIPHGTNTSDFYPYSEADKLKAKAEMFGSEDVFVFGSVNRNQVRKDFGSLIMGFAMFKHTFGVTGANALLYLHCNPIDPMGINIYRLCDRVGLEVGKDVILPKDYSENKGCNLEELNKIYNSFDCFITTTTAEGWGLCLEPFTKIPTINGVKNIKDIVVGDKVLGNSGNYHRVLDTTFRNVDELINIKTQYGFDVKATVEHPYFVYSDLTKFGEFKRLKDVEVGDYLGIVKPKGDMPLLNSLDLVNYVDRVDRNIIIEEDFISNKFAYSPKNKKWSISEISKKYNVSKSISESAKEHLNYGVVKKSSEVLKLCENLILDGYVKPNSIKTNRFLKLNDELLYLIGWYLAEGSCENGIRVEFSLNIDELHIANELKRIIENAFGISDTIIREMETKCSLRISNRIVAQFFKNTCGQGALNKKIPSFLIGSEKKLMPLVKGYIEGDGHIRFNRNHVSFSTISPSLAFQMQSILNSNGIFLGCTKLSKRGVGRYDSYKCIIPNHYVQKYMNLVGYDFDLKRNSTRNHKSNIIENETHFFVKIKDILTINKKTDVYDLCVEDTHSFIGNGLVCHNTITEAMATKTLVICPKHTSLTEITDNGENSLNFMFSQQMVFVNDFEKIRHISNPMEVKTLCEVAYNLKDDEPELQEQVKQKIENAYNKVSGMKWEGIAKQFKVLIDKLTK
jgi:intein/homing endonuclease